MNTPSAGEELPAKLDRGMLRYIKALSGIAGYMPTVSPLMRREVAEKQAQVMRSESDPRLDADRVIWINCEPVPVRVRLFRKRGDGCRPALLFMHGGGWEIGSPETHWELTATLAMRAGMSVISVDYALAPEHRFPTANQQCQSVLRWILSNASELKVDRSRVFVGGDSAGANLAASLTLYARNEGLSLAGQILAYPICDFDVTRPSYRTWANGPLLTAARMRSCISAYCPDPQVRRANPFAAPLLASSHAGLPPAYIALAEFDPVRDSGLAYAGALMRSGVGVNLTEGKGLAHGYLRAGAYSKAAAREIDALCDWLKDLG